MLFPFAFTTAYRVAAAPFGVTSDNALVALDLVSRRFIARYGPWVVQSSIENIRGAKLTGPFGIAKTIGPAHLSFADRGLTMASNHRRGVCISFVEPVPGIEPTGRIRHPGLTVTVADCDGLLAALVAAAELDTPPQVDTLS
jgi:hypothetical protein